MKRNPAPAIITALSDVWDRINAWLGRSQAEQAQKQDDEVVAGEHARGQPFWQ